MFNSIKKILSTDSEKNDIYYQLSNLVTDLNKVQIINGNYFDKISLKSGITTFINHKLGRKYNGIICVDNPDSSLVFNIRDPNLDATQVGIQSATTKTVAIWVF